MSGPSRDSWSIASSGPPVGSRPTSDCVDWSGMLARKGYPSGVAMAVVREAMRDDDVELAPSSAELASESSLELSD